MQSEESNTLVKLAKAVIEHAPEGGDAFWGIKFSDIEAALSAAEPVAWLVRLYANDGSLIDERVYREKPDIRSTARTDFIPLYSAPSGPSVAVKALLDDVWNAAVERAAAIANDSVHLTPDPGAAIKTMLNGRATLHPASDAALSAQVQDVAGWQPMNIAPIDGTEILIRTKDGCVSCAWDKTDQEWVAGWLGIALLKSDPLGWMPIHKHEMHGGKE